MRAKCRIHEAIVLLVLALYVLGCTEHIIPPEPIKEPPGQPPIQIPCNIPKSTRVDDVIAKTKAILQGTQCNEEFDDLYQNILKVAARDSKPSNRALIKGFIDWCYANGILYKNTARQKYGEYFSSMFMCLEKWPKICHQCSGLNEIERDMKAELRMKELGLLRISEDEARYNKAVIAFNQTLVVLKAACMACSD